MSNILPVETPPRGLAPAPVRVEIRVGGVLEGEHWQRWFEGMVLTVDPAAGETALRGPIADQAALYGLLARARDLALPLLSVTVGEGEQAGGWPGGWPGLRARRGGNWLLVLAYLLVSGAMAAVTIYLTGRGMDTALALGVLFVVLGGLAFMLFRREGGRGWLIAAGVGGAGAVVTLLLYVVLAGWVPLELMLAALGFVLGAGLLAALLRPRARVAQRVEHSVEWEPLGAGRRDEPDSPPAESPWQE